MRTKAQFEDPGDIPVTIVLSGSLSEFEEWVKAIRASEIPHYLMAPLTDHVSDVAFKLRKIVQPDAPEPVRPE